MRILGKPNGSGLILIEVSKQVHATFLAADSTGKYYNANIKGPGSDGPYDCRTHRT